MTNRIVVAVLTYRRPDDLTAVLGDLVEQAAAVPGAEVLVVDNDPAGGAASVVEPWLSSTVRYVHEPTPGIAAGRNRAIAEASDADALVYIDDDERPVGEWLSILVGHWRGSRVQAVVGPVLSAFSEPPPAWITAGRFFSHARRATGTRVSAAATNNLLLDMAYVTSVGLRFDEEFSLTGGSDTLFTRQLVASGGTIEWCDEAQVVEIVPASRATRTWVLRRAYRSGNSWARTSVRLAAGPVDRAFVRAQCILRGIVRLVGGGLRTGLGIVLRSPAHDASGRRTVMRGAGLVAGAVGSVYAEYQRPAEATAPAHA